MALSLELNGPHERLTDHSPLLPSQDGKTRPRAWRDISSDQLRIAALIVFFLITGCYAYWPRTASFSPTIATRHLQEFIDTARSIVGKQASFPLLEEIAPRLEQSASDTQRWWYLLSSGNCTGWAETFAQQGDFKFELHRLKDRFFQMQAVQTNFCSTHQIKAAKVVHHYWDSNRAAVLAVLDVFTEVAPAELYKVRWAQFAQYSSNDVGARIIQYKLYAEAVEEKNMRHVVHSVVQANIARLGGQGCKALEIAAAPTSSKDWIVQSLPVASVTYDEMTGKQHFLAQCIRDAAAASSQFDLQHGSIAEVFYSHSDMHVMLFFTRSRRYKNSEEIIEDPQALIVKLSSQPFSAVQSLYFFWLERGVTPKRQLLDHGVL